VKTEATLQSPNVHKLCVGNVYVLSPMVSNLASSDILFEYLRRYFVNARITIAHSLYTHYRTISGCNPSTSFIVRKTPQALSGPSGDIEENKSQRTYDGSTIDIFQMYWPFVIRFHTPCMANLYFSAS
jgi:hypothetical protein